MDPAHFFTLIIGAVMMATPLFHLADLRRARRRTEMVLGKVIGQQEQTSHTGHAMGNGHRIKTDHAVIAYEVKGKSYTCVASAGASWTLHPEGSEEWVCYDPDDPTNADLLPGFFTKATHFLLFLALPITGTILVLRFLLQLR